MPETTAKKALSLLFGWGVVIDDPKPVLVRATSGVPVLANTFLSRDKASAVDLAKRCNGRAVLVRVSVEEL